MIGEGGPPVVEANCAVIERFVGAPSLSGVKASVTVSVLVAQATAATNRHAQVRRPPSRSLTLRVIALPHLLASAGARDRRAKRDPYLANLSYKFTLPTVT